MASSETETGILLIIISQRIVHINRYVSNVGLLRNSASPVQTNDVMANSKFLLCVTLSMAFFLRSIIRFAV